MNLENAKRIIDRLGSHWPRPIDIIGKGADGAVYLTNSGKLLKITRGRVPQELRSLVSLQNTGFVPKVNPRNLAFVDNYTVFLMDRVGRQGDKVVNLREFYNYITLTRSIRPTITQLIKNMVMDMHIRGISHGDLHEGNILVSFRPENPRTFKLWFIDFGRSSVIPLGFTERDMFEFFAKHVGNFPRRSKMFNLTSRLPLFQFNMSLKHPLSKRKKPSVVRTYNENNAKELRLGKKTYIEVTLRGKKTLLRSNQKRNEENRSRNVNLLKVYGANLSRNEENMLAHKRIRLANSSR